MRLSALRLGRLVDQHETILIAVRGNTPPALPLWPSVIDGAGGQAQREAEAVDGIDRPRLWAGARPNRDVRPPAVRSPRLAVLGRRGAGRAHVRLLACYSGSMTPIKAAAVIARGSSGRVMLMQRADGEGWAWPGGGLKDGEIPRNRTPARILRRDRVQTGRRWLRAYAQRQGRRLGSRISAPSTLESDTDAT